MSQFLLKIKRMFNFCPPATIPDLVAETQPNGKRIYYTPEGNKYLSVTTVVGILKKQKIMEWRQRVGEETANRVSRVASGRGNNFHYLCEKYLQGDMPQTSTADAMELFYQVKPVINRFIDNIWYQEQSLWSDQLGLAGRVDLIAEFRGKISIIDFKTSKRIKEREDILDYFQQECAYSLMIEERIGRPIDQLVTIMACDETKKPFVFIEKTEDHIEGLVNTIQLYKNENNRLQRTN